MMKTYNILGAAAGAVLAIAAGSALAGGSHSGGHGSHGEQVASIGSPGTTGQIDRVIEVDMGEMYFSIDRLSLRRGETVRFVLSNSGRMLHEFNIGTKAMHRAHVDEMRAMRAKGLITARSVRHDRMKAAGMMHDDPNSVLLEPGQTGEIIWTFDGEAELSVSCNLPGHASGGMTAKVDLAEEFS